MATPTYDLIDSVTLTSAAGFVTFSSIPQDYRDLVLVAEFYANDANAIYGGILINDDQNNNYYYLNMYGTGSSTASFTNTQAYVKTHVSSATNTEKNFYVAQFMDYSATDKHKTVLIRSNDRETVRVVAHVNRWADTSAITQLSPRAFTSGDFAAGSTFYLYGIAS